MNRPQQAPYASAAGQAAQARVAARICAHLSQASTDVSPDIGERLRVARMRALEQARLQPAPQTALDRPLAWGAVTAGRGGEHPDPAEHTQGWLLFAAVLPLLLLIAGLVGVRHLEHTQGVRAAAEVDAELLADDLPPEAYADPGFAAFLQAGGQQP